MKYRKSQIFLEINIHSQIFSHLYQFVQQNGRHFDNQEQIQQILIMQVVKNGITKLDRYPSTPSIVWNGIKSKQTFLGGLIGLVFIILALVLVIGKGINVIDRSQIILESFTKKDETGVQMKSFEVQMVMFYHEDGMLSIVPYEYYSLFGIVALVVEVELDYTTENGHSTTRYHMLKPCASEEILCVPGLKYKPECSYDNFDFQVCNYVKEYHVIITNASQSEPILDGLYPALLLFDTKYNLFEKNISQILKQVPIILNKLTYGLGLDYRYIYDVPVSKLELTTDQSILPKIFSTPNYTETYFYPNDRLKVIADNQTYFFGILQTYFDFYIHRSGYTETYTRSYYRFDSMLGEIFGLIGLVGLLFAFLCSGYNEWLMKIHVEDSLNPNNLQSQNRKTHYGVYLKQKFNSFIRKFTNSQPRDVQILSESDGNEVKKQIDIIEMFHKIEKMDKQIAELKAQQNYRSR